MDDYDPKYPYFYIEDPVARYMNANEEFENIEKYRTLDTVHSTNITLKEVSELDFCQEKRRRNGVGMIMNSNNTIKSKMSIIHLMMVCSVII